MKRILCGAALILSVAAMAQQPDWANLQRYSSANKEVAQSPRNERLVVFLGNSITEKWAAMHPSFFTDNGYVGRGISGQTSYQFLVRFREDVIKLHPAIVVINAGTNDVAENTGPYSEEYTFGNIVSMVELAKANGIRPVLSAVLPAAGFNWNRTITDAPDKIESLNARIKAYAVEHGIPFVDYYTPMLAGADGALNADYTNDGVHPTEAGYDVMEGIVLQTLRSLPEVGSRVP